MGVPFGFHHIRLVGMVRYMDDVVCWDHSRDRAADIVRQAREFLQVELKLMVKKDTVQINGSARGLPICGYRVFAGTIQLARSRRQRYVQSKRRWEGRFQAGRINARELQAGYDAALAITAHAHAAAWRRRQAFEFSPSLWYEEV